MPRVFINGEFIGGVAWHFSKACVHCNHDLKLKVRVQCCACTRTRLKAQWRGLWRAGGDDTVAKAASGELLELFNKA